MKTELNHMFTIKKLSLFLFFYFLFITISTAQDYTTFKGEVVSENTNKALALADVMVRNTNISTVTNTEGEFTIKIPNNFLNNAIVVSFLGYQTKEIVLNSLKKTGNKIQLQEAATILAQVDVNAPKNAEALVRQMLKLKGENYYGNKTKMTAFYRETIKKRNKHASLAEAVVNIYKQPYASNKKDAIKLVKSRKKTNYSRLDTIALKLQGGPFSTLYTDIMKYPDFVFDETNLKLYNFTFKKATQTNNNLVYVVNFKQKETVTKPLYYGKLYIDANTYALTNAVYYLNVKNKDLASKMYVRKKPKKAKVYPTEIAYRVNYRSKNGKWYYGYSNVLLTFKVNWKNRLFNSRYTLQSEMAITNWEKDQTSFTKPPKGILKQNVILADEASGFAEPQFWGEYNIIEPEKSIENAIKKISKQLNKT